MHYRYLYEGRFQMLKYTTSIIEIYPEKNYQHPSVDITLIEKILA